MSSRNNSKIAHVIEHDGRKVLAFSKAVTTMIPPSMLFDCEDACKVFREGVPLEGHFGFKRRGVHGDELELYDRVQLVSIPDFYERLYDHGQTDGSCVVWLDPDLETALENSRKDASLSQAA